jgi:hypothetical protein
VIISTRERGYFGGVRERRPIGPADTPAQPALLEEDAMSIQTSPSVLAFRRHSRTATRRTPADPQLYVAVALLLAVLIAEAIFIAAAAPSLSDAGLLYAATT